ncbi:MAG: Type 1 glutamine amidotransferase-like domain-containing protein [Acidimicrobiales bacterium]
MTTGTLALVGGGEWRDGCDFDAALLEAAGTDEVLVLPTAAAYEHPHDLVAAATGWFAGLGAKVRGLDVLRRPDALDADNVEVVRAARFTYLAGGSPMHLRSVLKDTPVWDALVAGWQDGAVVAGSSAGAMVLCDPMVDPRGGAFTVGLGLLDGMAVVPAADTWSEDKAHRTRQLAPRGLIVAAVDERTALVRGPDGAWRVEGAGSVVAYRDGATITLGELP